MTPRAFHPPLILSRRISAAIQCGDAVHSLLVKARAIALSPLQPPAVLRVAIKKRAAGDAPACSFAFGYLQLPPIRDNRRPYSAWRLRGGLWATTSIFAERGQAHQTAEQGRARGINCSQKMRFKYFSN